MRAVHERISAQIKDSQLGLKACVDSLARNIQDLKDAMRWAERKHSSDQLGVCMQLTDPQLAPTRAGHYINRIALNCYMAAHSLPAYRVGSKQDRLWNTNYAALQSGPSCVDAI